MIFRIAVCCSSVRPYRKLLKIKFCSVIPAKPIFFCFPKISVQLKTQKKKNSGSDGNDSNNQQRNNKVQFSSVSFSSVQFFVSCFPLNFALFLLSEMSCARAPGTLFLIVLVHDFLLVQCNWESARKCVDENG